MNAITVPSNGFLSPSIISNIVLKGDVGGLQPAEKVQYYNHICERIGLDPATQPFQLLNLSGKQVMYATKSAAEQLTKIYGISHEIKDRTTINDVHIVYVRATEVKTGRFEDSSGAVSIGGLKADALCNALMKAETKAKRRSTLSLLGLGMLDETEVETIPNAQPIALVEESMPDKGGHDPIVNATPAEAKAIADRELGTRKLAHEDEVMPIGAKSNGKKFKDCSEFALKQALKACERKDVAEKYPTLKQHIEEFMNDSGLPFN